MHRRHKTIMKAIAFVAGLVVASSLMVVGAGLFIAVFVLRPLLSVLMFFLGVMSL